MRLPGRLLDSDAENSRQDQADGQSAEIRIGRQERDLQKILL